MLATHGIKALHPDSFIRGLLNDGPDSVVAAFRAQQATLKNPPLSMDQLLALFERYGLVETVSELRRLMGS